MGLRRISPCTDSVSLNISKSLNNSTHYVSIPAMFQEPRVCVGIRFQVYPISRLLINNQILVRKLIYKNGGVSWGYLAFNHGGQRVASKEREYI